MSVRNVISLLSVLAIASLGALPSTALAEDLDTENPCAALFDDSGEEWLGEDEESYDGEESFEARIVSDDDESYDDQEDEESYDDTEDDESLSDEDEDDFDDGEFEDSDWIDDPCYEGFTDEEIVPSPEESGFSPSFSRKGWLFQSILMPGPGTIDAKLTTGTSTRGLMTRARVVGRRHIDVKRAGEVKVRIKLNGQGRRLLRSTKEALTLSLTTTVAFDSGRTVTRTVPVTVQPRPAKNRKKRRHKKH